MTIILPDLPETAALSPDDLRLELACALYSRGRLGKVAGTEMAGVDFFTFQRALAERGVAQYSNEMLADDIQTLKTLFPS
ncbi:MAG: UPF0175 family protein [Verrucomicrobiota bacterium]|jgi:predicted HTH domain antitoxin